MCTNAPVNETDPLGKEILIVAGTLIGAAKVAHDAATSIIKVVSAVSDAFAHKQYCECLQKAGVEVTNDNMFPDMVPTLAPFAVAVLLLTLGGWRFYCACRDSAPWPIPDEIAGVLWALVRWVGDVRAEDVCLQPFDS